MERELQAQSDRIDKLEAEVCTLKEELADLKSDRRVNEIQFKTIMEAITEIKVDLRELKETPAKRWDLIIAGIISATVAFIVGRILK